MKWSARYARSAAAVAVCIAGYPGINPPGFVAQAVAVAFAFAFGLATSSFFPAIILGIFYKRMNKYGAISGMVSGLMFTTFYIVYFKFINPAVSVPDNLWFVVSPEGIDTLGVWINFAIAGLVCQFKPWPPQYVQDILESIRYPQGAGKARAH